MVAVKLQTDVNVQAETVDSALAAEDFAPLVRLVFDAFSASLNSKITKEALLHRPPTRANESSSGDAATGRRASDRTKVLRKQAAAPVIAALEQVLNTKSAELSQICRGNAEEIASSLQDLDSMQRISLELQRRIKDGDITLREAGGTFLSSLEQLQELIRVATAISASCKAVGAGRQLLSLCAQAGRAVNANELYKAHCLLQSAQEEFLGGSQGPNSLVSMEEDATKLSRTVRLHQFLTSKTMDMKTTMQEKAISDFNNWLVNVRREAKAVGMASLRRAAWHRSRDESLATQRRQIAAELPNLEDLDSFAASVAKPLPKLSRGTARLNARIHPAAVDVLSDGEVDPNEDVMLKIEMTPLHRCLQIHACLGRSATLKAYYQVNRRAQLNSDLAANAKFTQQYKAYISQVVGYFVTEDRVARATDAMAGQIDAGWETAVAYLKPALESAFQSMTDVSTFMTIKDLMLLACSALGQCGYHVAPILDVLLNGQTPFFELIAKEIQEKLNVLISTRRLSACEIEDANQAALLSGTLGLPLMGPGRGAMELGPTPPFTAPFSKALPDIMDLARKYVEDVSAYAWGLMSSAEMLSLVRLQRDTMLTNCMLASVEAALLDRTISDPNALYYPVQTISDLHCFSEALQALDDFTYMTVRGTHPMKDARTASQLSESFTLASQRTMSLPTEGNSPGKPQMYSNRAYHTCQAALLDALKRVHTTATQRILDVVIHRVAEIIEAKGYREWEPEEPIRHTGDHSEMLKALVAFLNESATLMKTYLWEAEYIKNVKLMVRSIGNGLIGMLLSDAVETFNLYAVFAMTDDALALVEAIEAFKIPGLDEGVMELLQTCDVLATGRIDDMLDEDKRLQSYPAINLKNFQAILKKFREIRQHSGSTMGNRKQPESFLKKKAVEKVAKLLRIQ